MFTGRIRSAVACVALLVATVGCQTEKPAVAAENVGYGTAPYAERAKFNTPVIDRAAKAVHVTIPNGATLTAKYQGSQGCVTLPAIPTRC